VKAAEQPQLRVDEAVRRANSAAGMLESLAPGTLLTDKDSPKLSRHCAISFLRIDQTISMSAAFSPSSAFRRSLAAATFVVGGFLLAASPAKADLRLCNMTSSRVGIALGYRDAQGWVTEGWWNLTSRGCETLLKGQLGGRFYYIYAIDYDRGGEWSGRSFMCTREREFTIRGTEDCLARGFDRSGFFEVDTGEQKSWTIQLTETNRPGGP
jgi:uncharacterized membrane protein